MNPILDVIKTRRSCRKFLPQQVPDDLLDAVIEAGLQAPSGRGAQSPIVIIAQDPIVIAELEKINAQVSGMDKNWFFGAPTVITVLSNPEICYTYAKDGMATVTNMLLAAHALGLSATCISRAKETMESAYGQALLHKLGISPAYVGIEHVILGYRDGALPPVRPIHDNRMYRI